jgi:hypothetical protein
VSDARALAVIDCALLQAPRGVAAAVSAAMAEGGDVALTWNIDFNPFGDGRRWGIRVRGLPPESTVPVALVLAGFRADGDVWVWRAEQPFRFFLTRVVS